MSESHLERFLRWHRHLPLTLQPILKLSHLLEHADTILLKFKVLYFVLNDISTISYILCHWTFWGASYSKDPGGRYHSYVFCRLSVECWRVQTVNYHFSLPVIISSLSGFSWVVALNVYFTSQCSSQGVRPHSDHVQYCLSVKDDIRVARLARFSSFPLCYTSIYAQTFDC